MVRIFSLVLMLSVVAGAAVKNPVNWRGYFDTVSITDTLKASTVKYSKALNLTDGEDIRVLVKFDDTASAGYGGDSIKFRWGYQIGTITIDTGTAVQDTAWDSRITVDTIRVDSLGDDSTGYCSASGTLTRYWLSYADTSSVAGYAVQNRWFVPEWGEVIRYWARALTGQRQGKAIVLRFEQHQRAYVPVGR